MEKRPEYIGISGVVNKDQQAELVEMFDALGLHQQRVLQLGVKATHKTQWLGIENKYGREWYPVGSEIDQALQNGMGTTGVAQICFDSELVHSNYYRREFIVRALARTTHSWLTGVQFDMLPWFDNPNILDETLPNGVYYLEDSAKDITVTLQCQGDIMQQHTPIEIADMLARYPQLDYVLFDNSCGRGIQMNADELLPYIHTVNTHNDLQDLHVAVGGGLNARVVRAELPKVLRHFPQVSWDAEGQLHPVNNQARRPLDMQMTKEYLEACAEVLE